MSDCGRVDPDEADDLGVRVGGVARIVVGVNREIRTALATPDFQGVGVLLVEHRCRCCTGHLSRLEGHKAFGPRSFARAVEVGVGSLVDTFRQEVHGFVQGTQVAHSQIPLVIGGLSAKRFLDTLPL